MNGVRRKEFPGKTYLKSFFIFTGILFCLSSVFAHAEDSFPEYDIDAFVNVPEKRIEARQRIIFTNQTSADLNEVYFHIYPNRKYSPREIRTLFRYAGYFKVDPYPSDFQQGNLKINKVEWNGQQLPYQIEGEDQTLLMIPLKESLRSGETIVLSLDFAVDIPNAFGRFGWHDGIIKAAYWYPILSVQTEEGWDKTLFYPFHRPFFSEAAYYHVRVSVPEEYVVIHSGERASEEVSDGHKTVTINTSLPIRSFSFATSPDYRLKEDQYNGITLKSYYLPGNDERAKQALENLKHFFAFYEKLFGPYPYSQFSIAPVHLGYGGEQMANMVFIDTRVYELPELLDREFDLLLAHESGHQWFYNMLGVDTYQEMWLEEGVNAYFILQYIEHKYGYDADILEYPEWFEPYAWMLPKASFRRMRDYRYQMESRMGYDEPLIGPLNTYGEPSRIFSLVYGKGVRLMEAIRTQIGDENFREVFQEAVERYRYQNWGIKDFIKLVEDKAGASKARIIKEWLYSDDLTDYAVYVDGNGMTVKHLAGKSGSFKINVFFQDGQSEQIVWDGQGERKEFVFDRNIEKAEIDPQGGLFEIERLNNVWPRQLNIKAVPVYVGLYDMPLFLPENSYNIVVGPEISNGIGVKASVQEPYQQVMYAATDYRFGEDIWTSRTGYIKKNIFKSPLSAGFEISDVEDFDGGEEDLVSGKIFLRKDFNVWPYGLVDIQDHAAFYMIRNQRLNDFSELASLEDERNLEYRRNEETILGFSCHLNRSAPYPDPVQGWRTNFSAEHGAHLLGAQQYFYRLGTDTAKYFRVTPQSKIAARIKLGLGFPDDKDLFQLGGIDGLRGYGRKELRGANLLLGILEYRFPLVGDLKYPILGRMFTLTRIDGSVFAETGRTWFSSYQTSDWKKDVGAGLRFHLNIAGFLEKTIVRLESAKAVDDPRENDLHFWLSINTLF
ncbi:MAG: M1 family aminopeptidase [Candidatus Omnitrophota bacterium]